MGVSVILPVHNGAAFLEAAIASVLGQTQPPDELMVVDDGSTDESAAIAAACAAASRVPLRYVRQAQRGPAAARNTGIRLAQGHLLAFQDADDLWAPAKLERERALLEQDPPVDMVIGLTQPFVDAAPGGQPQATSFLRKPYAEYHFQSKLIRASLFTRVGLLNEQLTFGEDVDWVVRALHQRVTWRLLPEVVVYYRRHAGNMTNQLEDGGHYLLQALQQAIRQRR